MGERMGRISQQGPKCVLSFSTREVVQTWGILTWVLSIKRMTKMGHVKVKTKCMLSFRYSLVTTLWSSNRQEERGGSWRACVWKRGGGK